MANALKWWKLYGNWFETMMVREMPGFADEKVTVVELVFGAKPPIPDFANVKRIQIPRAFLEQVREIEILNMR